MLNIERVFITNGVKFAENDVKRATYFRHRFLVAVLCYLSQHCKLVNIPHDVGFGLQTYNFVNASHTIYYCSDLGLHSWYHANESHGMYDLFTVQQTCCAVEIDEICAYLTSRVFLDRQGTEGSNTNSENLRVNTEDQIYNGYRCLAAMTNTSGYATRWVYCARQSSNGHHGKPRSWIDKMDGYKTQSITSPGIQGQTFPQMQCYCQSHLNPTCDWYLESILYRAYALGDLFVQLFSHSALFVLQKSATVKQYIQTRRCRCVFAIIAHGWGFSVIGIITLCVYVYRHVRPFLRNRYEKLKCTVGKLSEIGRSHKHVHYDSHKTCNSAKYTKCHSINKENRMLQIRQGENETVLMISINCDLTPSSFWECLSNVLFQRKQNGYRPSVDIFATQISVRSEIDSSPRDRNSDIPAEKTDLSTCQREGSTKENIDIGGEQANDFNEQLKEFEEEAENIRNNAENVNDQSQFVNETQELHYKHRTSELKALELPSESTSSGLSEHIADDTNQENELWIDQGLNFEEEDVDEKTNNNPVESISHSLSYLVCKLKNGDSHSPPTAEGNLLHEGPLMKEIHREQVELNAGEAPVDYHGHDPQTQVGLSREEERQILGLVMNQLGIKSSMHYPQTDVPVALKINVKLEMMDTADDSNASCQTPEDTLPINGIVDMKEKAEERDQQTDIKKASKGKTPKSKEDYVETLRDLTWLPPEQLPVPMVSIVVAVIFEPLDQVLKDLAVGEMPGPQVTMRYELLRLCTLRNYPRVDKPHIIRLAQAGFYYAAEGDEVICFVCGLRKRSWCETDVPMDVHKRISPNCGFFSRNSDYNVPVPRESGPERNRFAFLNDLYTETERTATESVFTLRSRTSDPNRESTLENNVRVSGATAAAVTEVSTTSTTVRAQTSTGARISGMPKFPQYAVRSLRVASYDGWPDNTGQEIEALSDAGFYYAGIGDCTRCFFCGIGLRHWSDDDNVWIEHARWSRNCGYLIQVKGEEFIRLVHMAIEYTTDADEQPGANGGSDGNIAPSEEIDRLLRSDAAQSVLEMGYQPRILKRALEMVLREHGASNIRAVMIMEKIIEMEELEEATRRVASMNIDQTSSTASNSPQYGNTDRSTSVRHQSHSEQNTESNERQQSSQDDNANIPEVTPTSESNPSTNSSTEGRSCTEQVSSRPGNSSQVSNTEQLSRVTGDSVPKNGISASSGASTASSSEPVQLGSRSLDSAIGPQQTTKKDQGRRRRNSADEAHGKMQKHLFAGQDCRLIRKENEELREQARCKVCMDKTVCIVFLPCGHLVTCEDCAPAMRKCPVCRALVRGTVKAFMG